jgi:hypothetical protein
MFSDVRNLEWLKLRDQELPLSHRSLFPVFLMILRNLNLELLVLKVALFFLFTILEVVNRLWFFEVFIVL